MSTDVMKLTRFNPKANSYHGVRDLTEDELSTSKRFMPIYKEAQRRFAPFRFMARNYRDWRSFLGSLLDAKAVESFSWDDEISRLLLNYLSSAYSAIEHFEKSHRRRNRKSPAELQHYEEFLEKLCDQSWNFAFILDFRGFVQHCELGVTRFARNCTDTSVEIHIKANAEFLKSTSRDWRRSKLAGNEGEMDLVPILQEFHIQMLQSYASFVAQAFYPLLKDASEFFGHLAQEACEGFEGCRMIFAEEVRETTCAKSGAYSSRINTLAVPNRVYRELGINHPQIS